MARNNGNTATIDEAVEEQPVMFPELDDANPEHKALVRAAKAYRKAKIERDELLSTAKEKMDSCMEKVIALMHSAGLEKFKHAGLKATLIPGKEKVQVKLDEDEEEGAGDDAEE